MIDNFLSWKKEILQIKQRSRNKHFSFITDYFFKKKLFFKLEKIILNLSKGKKVGILFSGGIDSVVIALICKKLNIDFICYTVGFFDNSLKFPKDVFFARKIAEQNKFQYKEKLFNLNEIELFVDSAINILSSKKECYDVVNVGVATVELAALSLAEQDSCTVVFTGLGAEEVFAGYHRHKTSKNLFKDSWEGILNFYVHDIIRENKIQSTTKVLICSPFTNLDIIELSMKISFSSKINKHNNKLLLRRYAKNLGLKKHSNRKKLAAQYGSNINKALYRIAKKNGFKSRTEYLNSFVDSDKKIFIP